MKKCDLKKLALLGIVAIASQGTVQADEAKNEADVLSGIIAAGCGGGSSGCSGMRTPRYLAESDDSTRSDSSYDTSYSSGQVMTEDQLLSQLSDQGRQIYQNLSPEGKALALKLANSPAFKDKNSAVRAAAQKLSERRAQMNTGSY